MLRSRIIPRLLLHDKGLTKTEKFNSGKYIGDPINAVRIFNEKEVDELAFVDISVGINCDEPDYELIGDMASEAFMPIAYGGGIRRVDQVEKLFRLGVEKVIINSDRKKSHRKKVTILGRKKSHRKKSHKKKSHRKKSHNILKDE